MDSATAAKLRVASGLSSLAREHSIAGSDYETYVNQMSQNLGIAPEQLRSMLMLSYFPPQPGAAVPGGSGQPAQAGGQYTELGQRAWKNNQTRINLILRNLIEGSTSEGRARLDLQSIGLDELTVQSYIDDARDGALDSLMTPPPAAPAPEQGVTP